MVAPESPRSAAFSTSLFPDNVRTPRCVDVACDANEYCDVRGRCVNKCDEMGVFCPVGQQCERMTGRCVEPMPAGPEPAMVRDDQRVVPDAPNATGDVPNGAFDGGVVADMGFVDPFLRRGGCACRAPTAPASTASARMALLAMGIAAVAFGKRRRSLNG